MMIINMDREPKYSLYYIGAIILQLLMQNNELIIEEIHKQIKIQVDDSLHIDFIYYALDWLFLLSLIRMKGDKIELC